MTDWDLNRWKAENDALSTVRNQRWMSMTDREWEAELRAREIILSAHPELAENMREQDARREELASQPPPEPDPPVHKGRHHEDPHPLSEAEEAALDEHVWRVFDSWIWRAQYTDDPPVAHALDHEAEPLCHIYSRSGWAADILTLGSRRCLACSRVVLSAIRTASRGLGDEDLEPVFPEPVDLYHETVSLLHDFYPHGWPSG